MTTSPSTVHDRLATVRKYRRLFGALLAIAVLGFIAGSSLGYPIAGVGVYWAGVLGMVLVWKGTSLELFDERERTIERRASNLTLTAFAFVLIVGGPGQLLYGELGYQAGPLLQGALWGYAAQFAFFGLVYLGLRSRA